MRKTKEPSEVFSEMAARINRNDPKEFGGAFVIVAPDGSVLDHASISTEPDLASFWSHVSSIVQIATAEVMNQQTQIEMLNRGRR